MMTEPTPDSTPDRPPETPLAFRVVRGGLWVAAGSYFNVGFGFLANLVLTRILAPDDFGLVALAGFFFGLINLRPKLGLTHAFAQRRESSATVTGTFFRLELGSGLATVALATAAVPVLRLAGYGWEVVWIVLALAAGGVLDSITATPAILLDKELRFKQASLATSVLFPFSYLPAFGLAIAGAGFWSLVAQPLTQAVFQLGATWWIARRTLPDLRPGAWRFDRPTAADLLRFGAPLGLAGLAAVLLSQFDNFLVGTFVGVTTLGYYDRAYRTALWPALLLANLATRSAFYTYAHLQSDLVRLRRALGMTHWLTTTLGLTISVGMIASAPDLVLLLYGERWLPSAVFLRFLVLYSATRPIAENANSLFTAIGRPRLVTLTGFLEAGILIAAGLPLTLTSGAVGTAIAVGLAFGVGLAARLFLVRRLVGLATIEQVVVPAAAAALALAGLFVLNRVFETSEWALVPRVLAKSGYAVAAFLAILWIVQHRQMNARIRYVRRLWRREGGEPDI